MSALFCIAGGNLALVCGEGCQHFRLLRLRNLRVVQGPPERFDFAGDDLSGEEQAKFLSQAIGRPVTYQEIPIEGACQQTEDTALMFEWFGKTGCRYRRIAQEFSGGPLGAC